MSRNDPNLTTEDVALKRAVEASWGGEGASEELRRRVQMAMTRTVLEEPSIPTTSRSWWERLSQRGQLAVAAAAIVLVAVGVTWALVNYDGTPTRDVAAVMAQNRITPALSQTLYGLLVVRHEQLAAGEDADEPVAGERLQAMRESLAGQLRHPVWAPDLTKAGFTFHGVSVFTINGVDAVALTYTRGGAAVSAISVPVRAEGCGGDMSDLDLLVDNRPVVGFNSTGNLFALVGSQISPAEVRALSAQFRADVTSGIDTCAHP